MLFFTNYHDSKWIGESSSNFQTDISKQPPAPWFRHEFDMTVAPTGVRLAVCGLGYYELYINGQRVGDQRLTPTVTAYDKRARYLVHDVSSLLKKGRNTIGVVLGRGLYDMHTPSPWVLEFAPWRDAPKLRLELRSRTGRLLTASDNSWKVTTGGPILFDALHAGEWYDARKELGKWSQNGYDDAAWESVRIVHGPGGLLEEETSVPVRIVDTQELTSPNSQNVYDLKRNVSGHARITVKGQAGSKVILRYTERIQPDGDITQADHTFSYLDNTYWQYDEYTLKGGRRAEVWEPRFTYHGFQYVKVTIEGNAVLQKLEARIVHSDFKSIGTIRCGNDMINTLQTLTRRSFLSNFVGIPTDCPHREKNGWTGDAQLASETGLMNFDASASYRQWIDTLRDCQRISGELPGIAPTGGWGFNWGNGPAWDCALFVIPWNIFLYTGDDSVLKSCYDAMKRYLDYLVSLCVDTIVQNGLGDWCSRPSPMVDAKLTNTAIYYHCLKQAVFCARRFGHHGDAVRFATTARAVKKAFHAAFYKGNGVYANGEETALGAALYFDLCPTHAVRQATLQQLVRTVESNGATASFGILGAKYVPRVLADNGYVELASAFFTQEAFPGWAHWVLADGATSLHESWTAHDSWNHIMFGDLSAWLFKYPGGMIFSEQRPGFRHLTLRPCLIPSWKTFTAEHRGYACSWSCTDSTATITIRIPKVCSADIILPDGTSQTAKAGTHTFTVPLSSINPRR